ncbi:hypothetical protein DXG01_007093 [Tephrocybe rancida]|nr:hypothetical protein DXG01_007093 [Tephrocybe rancida]
MFASLPALSAVVLFAAQALGNPEPAEAIPGLLLARQVPGFDPSTVPAACKSDCEAVTTSLTGCASVGCICKDSTISTLGKCLDCGVSISGSGLDVNTAQSAIDQIVSTCKSAGSPVSGFSVSAKGTKGNGAARSTIMGAGAMAVAILGAFVILV